MNAIQRLEARLGQMDGLVWERDGATLRVLPTEQDGFEVAITVDDQPAGGGGRRYMVSFDGWHEYFTNEDNAVECFAFGLSDACRLFRWSREGRAYRWTVEALTDDGWVKGRTVGMLLFPLVDAADVHCFQNDYVQLDLD